MNQPIGFFTWAYRESKRAGVAPGSGRLAVAIAMDGAVLAFISMALTDGVRFVTQ